MFLKTVVEIAGVTLGVLLTALGLDIFLIPSKIAAGGVSGIATVLHYILHVPVGMTMLLLNIPLFIMGIYRLGLKFGFRSLYGTISLSLLVDGLAPYMPVPTRDPLLASIFGGVLVGLGLGLVFKYRGTTGGTDLAAAVIRTYTGANVGQLLFMVDAFVVLAAGFSFKSWELAMYALITIFITAWLIDVVQQGFSYAKAFYIISSQPEKMTAAVLQEINRGATVLRGRGAYSGTDRDVLLVVVNRSEVTRLKDLIYEIDSKAFVILTDAHEVLGEGFKPLAVQTSGVRRRSQG
ncbi:MAG: membrane protein [Peptococcaceae bacterium BRH_c4a]|nr:MAG: membrane protein [Peptococcaceae bacterium BRH_c4a]